MGTTSFACCSRAIYQPDGDDALDRSRPSRHRASDGLPGSSGVAATARPARISLREMREPDVPAPVDAPLDR